MPVIDAYNKAWENGDVETLEKLIHDDCVFNPHVGGITMGKSDILGFAGSGNAPTSENNRILNQMSINTPYPYSLILHECSMQKLTWRSVSN